MHSRLQNVNRAKALYRKVLPRQIRDGIYWLTHREHRLERFFFSRTRLAINRFVETAAREQWLTGTVLEIGSGTSTFARDVFARHCPMAHVLRSDVSAGGYGRQSVDGQTEYALLCDVTKLGLADETLDGVICSEVLEHVCDYRAAFTEVGRVLRPGGRLLLTSPFLYPLHGPYDYWRFTPQAFEHLLDGSFRILRLELATLYPRTRRFPVNIGILAERMS